MNRFVFLLPFLCTACVTVTKGTLPQIENTNVNTEKKISLIFQESIHDELIEVIVNGLKSAGLNEKNISTNFTKSKKYVENDLVRTVNDFFPIQNQLPPADIKIEIVFRNYGFFEPYCALFLAIIPCTPPYKWLLGARVSDQKKKFVKDYILKESAVGIFWMPFFVPSFYDKNQSIGQRQMDKVMKNLIVQMRDDNLF